MKKNRKPFDFLIFMAVLILLSMGLVMVLSASYYFVDIRFKDSFKIIKGQLVFAVIGVIGMLAAANFDYRKLSKFGVILMVISIVMLVLCKVPGIGIERNGSARWINLGITEFQPSELAKLSIILFFSNSLSRRKDQLNSFFRGFMPYILLLGLVAGLILIETHLSGTIIISSVAIILLFSAGAKLRHLFILATPAVAGLTVVALFTDYMNDRIQSFINPWKDSSGDGWQIVQGLYAIGSGGIFGRGLGRSLQKFLYIPEPHNDYIFAILAEELGFIGVLAVLFLFLVLIWRGIKVALNAPDTFGSLVAVGITSLIGVQSLFNIAVVTKAVPSTGVSLPFFSYGGTALVLFLVEMGILLNISRYSNYDRI